MQTLMRRIARGCLHFVQVSSPLARTALFHSPVFTVSRYSDPPRPHHPPLHQGSHLGNLAASAHRRILAPTPALGSPKFPASLMEYCALESPRFSPTSYHLSNLNHWTTGCSSRIFYVCLFHSICTITMTRNTLPNTIFTIAFIGFSVAFYGQVDRRSVPLLSHDPVSVHTITFPYIPRYGRADASSDKTRAFKPAGVFETRESVLP